MRRIRVWALCVVVLVSAPLFFARAQDAGAAPDLFGEVARLVAANRNADALRALDAMDARLVSTVHRLSSMGLTVDVWPSSSGRYLRGRLLERLSRPSEAADAFAGALDHVPSEIADDARRRRVVLLAQATRCDEALSEGAQLRSPGAEIEARLSECALSKGDHAQALTRIERAINAVRARAAVPYRLTRAEIYLAQNQRDRGVRELRAILLEQPGHRKAEAAATRLAALHATQTWTFAEHLARAEAFSAGRQHGRAVEELNGLNAPRARGERARFLHVKGMALFGTRRSYQDAARVLAEAARLRGEHAVADEFHAARALARSDQEPAAVAAYRRFVRSHNADDRAPEAAYLAALSLLRRGDASGVAEMQRFLRGPLAARGADFVREGNAQLAFFQFRQEHYADAARAFAAFAATGSGGMVEGRGHYWAARSLVLANRRAQGIAEYRAAIAAEPLHWYGQLARARLVELGQDVGPPFAAPATSSAAREPLHLHLPETAIFYAALGLQADARAVVRANESYVRTQAPRGREVEALVNVYEQLGDADRTYHLTAGMRDELSRRPANDNAWVWRAAYPRPWSEIVDAESRSRQIPEDYLYAIMRQESGYDPDVVSVADAIGLLQLLPSTASRVGETMHERIDRQDLFDPRTNIRVSAVYTGNLYRTFHQQAPLSIGAYNGGAPRMQRWLSTTSTDELDLFVERIPVDQTRNYIRRVMSHWARYRYMRDPNAGWPVLLSLRLDRAHVDAASAAADR